MPKTELEREFEVWKKEHKQMLRYRDVLVKSESLLKMSKDKEDAMFLIGEHLKRLEPVWDKFKQFQKQMYFERAKMLSEPVSAERLPTV